VIQERHKESGDRWEFARGAGSVLALASASRLLVILAARFAERHIAPDVTYPVSNIATSGWLRWDAAWYLSLATQGYTSELQTAFFPLYPILASLLARSTSISPDTALLIIPNTSFMLTCVFLFALVRQEVDADAAFVAVASLCFFPTNVFLSAGYTESLFLLLAVAMFSFLRTGKLGLAAFVVGFASATRTVGWLLTIPVLVEAYRTRNGSSWKTLQRHILLGLVSLWGLIGYMLYLGMRFGDPVLFLKAWHKWDSRPIESLRTYLPWNVISSVLNSDSREVAVNFVFFLWFVFMICLTAFKLPARYTAFALSFAMLVYLRGPYTLFAGTGRHLLSAVPLYLSIGVLLRHRHGYALAIISLFAGLSVFWTALYFQGYPIR
jgi:Gpi18-like mannosyltransferase